MLKKFLKKRLKQTKKRRKDEPLKLTKMNLLSKKELNERLNEVSDDSIVVTFVNHEYLNIFILFYEFWKKHNNKNLLVVCLDDESGFYMKQHNIRYILYNYSVENRHNFWKVRLHLINEIFLTAKRTIIHTDSDCFWIRNILPLIAAGDDDAFYSTGKGHPKHIVEQQGFVLCCGLFAVKFNSSTINYFESLLHQQASADDQIATNEWVFKNKKQKINFSNNSIFDFRLLVENLSIACIRQTAVTRWDSPTTNFLKNCFCVHPYLTGTNSEKTNKAAAIAGALHTALN